MILVLFCNSLVELVLESVLRDGVLGLYGEDQNTYEEIGYAAGDVLKTLHNKLSDPDSIKKEFQVSLELSSSLDRLYHSCKKRFLRFYYFYKKRVIRQ